LLNKQAAAALCEPLNSQGSLTYGTVFDVFDQALKRFARSVAND
jgi:hypothetical protein